MTSDPSFSDILIPLVFSSLSPEFPFTYNSPAEYLFAWKILLLNFVYLNEMLLVCYMTATCLASFSQGMFKFLETYVSDLSNQQAAFFVLSGVLRHWCSEFSQKLEPLCHKSDEF